MFGVLNPRHEVQAQARQLPQVNHVLVPEGEFTKRPLNLRRACFLLPSAFLDEKVRRRRQPLGHKLRLTLFQYFLIFPTRCPTLLSCSCTSRKFIELTSSRTSAFPPASYDLLQICSSELN